MAALSGAYVEPIPVGSIRVGPTECKKETQRSCRESLDSDALRADDRACLMGFGVFYFRFARN